MQPIRRVRWVLWVGLMVGVFTGTARSESRELPVVFQSDFQKGAAAWKPSDPQVWKVLETPEGPVYAQLKGSKYQPPFRSPLNFSLIKDITVADFVLEARARSTIKDYGHRDMCLFFGYQDPAHYYYVHLGKKGDEHCNQIFIVNQAARKKITIKTNPGTPWDDNWHKVRLVRGISDGRIEVFFDDMTAPTMTAQDKTFAWGLVGVGSFDDTGHWKDVTLRGVKVEKKVPDKP